MSQLQNGITLDLVVGTASGTTSGGTPGSTALAARSISGGKLPAPAWLTFGTAMITLEIASSIKIRWRRRRP